VKKGLLKNLKFLIILLFGLILFSNLISAVDVTACGTLSSANTIYILQNNISSTGTCITIAAANITLDLNGFYIFYGYTASEWSYGIFSNKEYITIKNGFIYSNYSGTNILNTIGLSTDFMNHSRVENMTFFNNGQGCDLYHGKNNTYNNITAISNKGTGIYIYESINSVVSNAVTKSNSGTGLSINSAASPAITPTNNTIINITSINNSQHGIYIIEPSFNNTLKNIISTNNKRSGVYNYQADNNTFINITSDSNTEYGFYLYSGAKDNNLINLTATSNGDDGFYSLYNNNFTNIIANSNSDQGFYIWSSVNVALTNLTTTSNGNDGIYATNMSNCIFTNLTSNSNGDGGMYLASGSKNNVITNLIANSNVGYGLAIVTGSNDSLFTNVITNSNQKTGVTIQTNSRNNTFINLTSNYNVNNAGISLSSTSLNKFTNVTTNFNNHSGIHFWSSASLSNNFTNVISNFNNISGVYFNSSSNNTITNLTADSNTYYGLFFNSSSNNTIKNSKIENNNLYGLYFEHSGSTLPQYNYFYNNIINNSINYYNASALANYFNTSLTTATNIMNRLYIGGNFWGTPNGAGFSDTCTDADKNGICDSSYNIDGVNRDYFPLYISDTSGPTMTLPVYTNGTLKNISETLTLNILVDDVLSNISACIVEVNGTNQSVAYSNGWCNSSSIYLAGMSGGNNTVRVYANDSLNNFGLNNSYAVSVDAAAPTIEINLPTNRTYSTDSITFNIGSTDDSGVVSSCNYSLDGGSNISLTYFGGYWMKTNSSMTETNHNVTFYCIDSFGRVGSSTEYFAIDVPEDSSSTGGASSVQTTTTIPEKSITVYLGKVIAAKEVTSVVALEGIYLTRITTLAKENISSATISIKTINNIVDAGLLFGLDEENIYQGLEINSSLKNENLENVTFEFKIKKSWLSGKDILQVTVQRKSGNATEWEMLNTTLIDEDNEYYYFSAISSGFSLFAIYLDENLCAPGKLFCSKEVLKLCHEDRSSTIIENCEFGCSSGKCLEYWEPDDKESVLQRFTKLAFGTWLNFGTIVFMIIVAIILLSLVLVSYVTYKFFERRKILIK
jgi:PGF-pre-PGF domain-containing protein